jgi:hypothetical protein
MQRNHRHPVNRWVRICLVALLSGLAGCTPHYLYRAVTENCNCEEFVLKGSTYPVDYRFRATYSMDDGIMTSIDILFMNRGKDTLLLYSGGVKVSSKNVNYQYNNRFVPLPFMVVAPGRSERVVLTGKDIGGQDDWNKIAGERMTVTIRGIRLGETRLPEVSVEFIPENPKLAD